MAQENDITFCRIPEDAAERWQVVRDVIAGDQALRSYLPTLNKADHSQANLDRNAAYKRDAVFYPATGFTLAGLIGLAFRHDPTSDLLAQLKYLLTNCDGAGVSIYQQSQASLAAALGPGRHGLYTDYSSALGRPIIKAYTASNIINWRESLVGGKTVRTLVVLHEDAEQFDEYAVTTIDQWRELFLDGGVAKCRLWQLDDDTKKPVIVPVKDADGVMQKEIVLRSSGAPLDEIPFDFIGSENNDSSIDPSPLYGLAQENIAHFKNSAIYEDSVFFVGQAQPWMSGLDQEWRDHLEAQGTMYTGSRSPVLLPAGGQYGFAQPLPNTLVKEAMDQKEAQMIALGARALQPGTVAKTATQATGEREASTSILAMCCANVSEAYQRQIARCARYLDIKLDAAAVTYKLNQDFASVSSDPMTITALVGAWQAGVIAKPDVRSYFRRQGTVDPERTDEAIDADIAAQVVVAQPNGSALAAPQSVPAVPVPAPQPIAAPAADFGPLLASIGTLVDALGRPAESQKPAEPPIDLAPLIAAMPKSVDLTPFAEAMRAQADAIRAIPAPVVNYQAGDVNVAPPAINFEAGSIAVNPAGVTVEGPTVNMPAAAMPQAPEPWQDIEFKFNEAGDVIGATRK